MKQDISVHILNNVCYLSSKMVVAVNEEGMANRIILINETSTQNRPLVRYLIPD